jgi:hypothetical protein
MTDQTISSQLAALADLDNHFQLHQIAYRLFGGWAVDFHVGQVTRAYGDLDIAVWCTIATVCPRCSRAANGCIGRTPTRMDTPATNATESGARWHSSRGTSKGSCRRRSARASRLSARRVRRGRSPSARRARTCPQPRCVDRDKSVVRDDSVTDAKDGADLLSLDRHAPGS